MKKRADQITPLRAAEFMSGPVVGIQADASIREAAQEMAAHRISGLVVMDDKGKAVGILSASDIVAYESTRHDHVVTELEERTLMAQAHRQIPGGCQLEHADDQVVGDIMTPNPVTLPPEATLGRIAWTMSRKRIHRVCIERDGQIVGIVSALDVVRLLGKSCAPEKSIGAGASRA